jgi:hypothetical protein
MATTTTTPEQVAEQYAAAEAEAARHRAKLDAIADAENTARHQAALEHFTHAAGERAHQYGEARDAARQRLDDLADAEPFDLNAVTAAFLDWKVLDKRCLALNLHAHRLNQVQPLGRDRHQIGLPARRSQRPSRKPAPRQRPTPTSKENPNMAATLYYSNQAFALSAPDVTAIEAAVGRFNGNPTAGPLVQVITLSGGQTVVIAPGVALAYTTS